MAALKVRLFGGIELDLRGRTITRFRSHAVASLLAYLLVHRERTHSRVELATLLFPDQDEPRARANLRTALCHLKKLLGPEDPGEPPYLLITPQTIGFNRASDYRLDIEEFEKLLAEAMKASPERAYELRLEALKRYRGDALAGCYEDWVLCEQERLRVHYLQALEVVAEYEEGTGLLTEAIEHLRQHAAISPLQEEIHRKLIKLFLQCGNLGAAWQQYRLCERLLAVELGVAPTPETQALREQLAGRSPPEVVPHNLPAPPTRFIGRERELARIEARLGDPACRLLTLVGPGGIGKTRLALQAASRMIERFPHGVYLIALALLDSPELIVSTMADVLRFSFYGRADPEDQLASYLREKKMLLILDGFEHVIRGTTLVAKLIQTTPHVKFLITSRERLCLQEEWLFKVQGMPYPPDSQLTRANRYRAVQLFLESARHADSSFTLSDENIAQVARICQLVEGMPLAIELAAAWVRALSCEEIAHEIREDLDFLSTSLSDLPERHRSLRAVFDRSWELLTREEQRVFARLSVFRGGFSREAVKRVAGAPLEALSTLMDKSLLHRAGLGHYELHELLRRYAEEKLEENGRVCRQVHDAHCAYYADYVHRREKALRGEAQRRALEEIAAEIENIRAGWLWAVEHRRLEALNAYLDGLFHFLHIRSRFQEGGELFRVAAERIREAGAGAGEVSEEASGVSGRLMARQGVFQGHTAGYEHAKCLLTESLALAQQAGDPQEIAFVLHHLSDVLRRMGEYPKAMRYGHLSLRYAEQIGDQLGMARAHQCLGTVHNMIGNDEYAEQHYRKSLEFYTDIGDQRGIAASLNNLGAVADSLERSKEGEQYYRKSLEIRKALGDHMGVSVILNNLGCMAYQRDL